MWAVETTEHSTDVWTMSLEEQNQPNLKTILYVLCILSRYTHLVHVTLATEWFGA